ncbi:ABC-type transport system involved in multi-copper enzyme maturation permease subunit [Mucilaginibacter sp. SG538B]|uniref:hypothetical protein n=1 Tax=Mucilaginibacter sp. SG538B TaxID=2587021 RepID=UPI00159DE4B7|nr:hypothetical protein [Mucilaginibacter sp. SG538B]NVM61990.1 ABC-type transport system involved in multi-copper enzyme maturation permease subunit [Mucilaginibacter sp. SG538B]
MLLVIISLLLIIAAPVLQIIFSILRIMRKTSLPLIVTMALSIIVGIGFSIIATNISVLSHETSRTHCFTPETALFLGGVLLITIMAPVTFIISYVIYIVKQKRQQPTIN